VIAFGKVVGPVGALTRPPPSDRHLPVPPM